MAEENPKRKLIGRIKLKIYPFFYNQVNAKRKKVKLTYRGWRFTSVLKAIQVYFFLKSLCVFDKLEVFLRRIFYQNITGRSCPGWLHNFALPNRTGLVSIVRRNSNKSRKKNEVLEETICREVLQL